MRKENNKDYKYKHNCPKCERPLIVKFRYDQERNASVGYCNACGYDAIVGKRGNSFPSKQ